MNSKSIKNVFKVNAPVIFSCQYGSNLEFNSNEWKLFSGYEYSNLNFNKLSLDDNSLFLIKYYCYYLIETRNNKQAINFILDFSYLNRCSSFSIDSVFSSCEVFFNILKKENKLNRFYRVKSFINWLFLNFNENNILSEPDFLRINRWKLKGNVKGEAVRREDLESGPLHDVEVTALREAVNIDSSNKFEHLQERMAVLMSLAFGRNPANFVLLQEQDFYNAVEGVEDIEPQYFLKIPRIKKRGVNIREEFSEVYVNSDFAEKIIELIGRNREFHGGEEYYKPLFTKTCPDEYKIENGMGKWAYHFESKDFTNLIKRFVLRTEVCSPLTGELLNITTRRLRYTFATSMVRQGVSPNQLAVMLDHSDLQNVQVYFDMKGYIVEHLDKVFAEKMGSVLGLFKGEIISDKASAINGEREDRIVVKEEKEIGVCGLTPDCLKNPPLACYTCERFQPFIDFDHEQVLDDLIKWREEEIDNPEKSDRIAMQLDDTIMAIADIVKKIREIQGDS